MPPPTSMAFPSGTAAAVFGAATFVALAWGWKVGVPALVFAAIVSFTRVYAGIHWPSDMVGGAAVGALSALGIWLVARRTQAR